MNTIKFHKMMNSEVTIIQLPPFPPKNNKKTPSSLKLQIILYVNRFFHSFVPNFCQIDELSCLFTNRCRAGYLNCRKYPNPFQNFFYLHFLNCQNLVALNLLVNKQLNPSLRQKLGTFQCNSARNTRGIFCCMIF